jgi:TonB family protein
MRKIKMKNAFTLAIVCALFLSLTVGCKSNLLSESKAPKSKCAVKLPALNSATSYAERGNDEIVEGNYECAFDDCQKAIDLDAKNAAAFSCRGYVRQKRREFKEAENDFDRAAELEPDNPIFLFRRSQFYSETNQPAKALTDINRTIEIAPVHYHYECRADVYADSNDFENALQDYTEAIRLEPENELYYKKRAEVYRKLSKSDFAAADERKYGELQTAEEESERSEKESRKTSEERIAETILNDKAVSLPKPAYPIAARTVHASGEVRVQVAIDAKGNVTSAKAVSGHPFLRATAEQSARAAKFQAAMSGTLIFNFVAQ